MLTVKTATHQKQTRLVLDGELTIYTASQAKREIPPLLAKHEALEVDLSGVEELDTAGVQVLLWLKRGGVARGRSLPFVFHSPAVMEVFDMLKVGGTFGDPVLLDPPKR
jgi:anti-anti-sigma factor